MKSLIVISLTATMGLLCCNTAMGRSLPVETQSTDRAIESLQRQAPTQPSPEAQPDRPWEEQGKASTGESIRLNLDSIQVVNANPTVAKSPKYLFQYRLGTDRIYGMTFCNGEFSTSRTGHRYGYPIQPKSEANRRMLDRVCTLGKDKL